jgi:holo-[acyl-carrier protein] synthase
VKKSDDLVKGLGTDIIEIARIRDTFQRHKDRFCKKILTENELSYCFQFRDPATPIAGRFAAKEAIAKALGNGIGASLAWLDIEILNKPSGQPTVSLSDRAETLFHSPTLLISISHSKHYATATALWLST